MLRINSGNRYLPRFKRTLQWRALVLGFLTFAQANALSQQGINNDLELGIQLYNQNSFAKAVESLRKAVKVNKQDYDAWYYLGMAQFQTRDLKNATKSFETALKLRPDSAAGHASLAYTFLMRNKPSDASREAHESIALNARMPDGHYITGAIRLRADQPTEALAEAETALKLDSQFAPAYLLKSQAIVKSVAGAILDNSDESPEERKQRYRDAATALEAYLRLSLSAPFKETWAEQLETLRLLAADRLENERRGIFSAKEVTTRVRVLAKPEPTYTEQARQNGTQGTVTLRCVFMADGTVQHFFVVSGLPDGLTEQAINSGRQIKFIPATKDGKPVSMWMELQYNFSLY